MSKWFNTVQSSWNMVRKMDSQHSAMLYLSVQCQTHCTKSNLKKTKDISRCENTTNQRNKRSVSSIHIFASFFASIVSFIAFFAHNG